MRGITQQQEETVNILLSMKRDVQLCGWQLKIFVWLRRMTFADDIDFIKDNRIQEGERTEM